MSYIDQLLAQLAPEGVALQPLGELGVFVRGNGLQKSDLTDSGFPAIHYGQIHTHYGIWTEQTKSFTERALAAKLRHAHPGDLVIATTSEDSAAVAKATAWLGHGDIAVSSDAYIYRHNLDPRFVAYFFASERFQEQKGRFVTGTKVRRISSDALSKIRIPVPPLEVQREIVRILDKFTQLEAEIKAELEARRRQYDHYRNGALKFDDAVERVSLSELAIIGTGSHDTKDAVVDGEYVFYARGREPLRLDSFDFEETAIITAGDGVGVGKVFHFVSGQYALHQRAYRIVPNSRVNARYLYHYLISDFGRYLERTSVHASVTSLRRPMFLKYQIAVPTLERQHQIAAGLDKFDKLVNDPKIGLPAELAARGQQYEYYRDKLLTFEEGA